MPLPAHLFASDDGGLYDTRSPDWSKGKPLRTGYQGAAAQIETLAQVKAALRAGGFTFPGAYPLYFVTRDGCALSFDAVRAEFAEVCEDFLADVSTGWRITGCTVNYEDSDLTCEHTGEKIPAAYSDE
ncbi:hypothetical protein BAJUN_01680 [Bajunvirus bajun]|uniref:Uncharacterized protein n=1 Tax=Brevundimonas phage vB_BgoS-Bajun TaxID=2948594 RepID=A0A9E7N4M0_9CAUD|nr:hypothetical protein BAJUN_01680 [Brevundimonas phage vB_BgoS-Bajun]